MKLSEQNILFLSHDANRAGAQLFLLNVMQDFKVSGYGVHLLCLHKWGSLIPDFEKLCAVHEIPKAYTTSANILSKLSGKSGLARFIKKTFGSKKINLIYANTVATSCSATKIKSILGVPLISHIHELQFSLNLYSKEKDKDSLLKNSDGIIACSQAVKENLVENNGTQDKKVEVIHSFVDNQQVLKIFHESDPEAIKKEFGLPEKAFFVGACGNAEWRKGLDVFVALINDFKHKPLAKKVHFVWIGLKPDGEYYEQIMYDVRKMKISEYVTFISPTSKAVEIINALDFFVVSSREDPFPLVMLEAALCQKPILGFKNTGGCSEFVKDEAGLLADYLDVDGLAQNLVTLISNEDLRKQKGLAGQQSIIDNYNFEHSVTKLKKYLSGFLD